MEIKKYHDVVISVPIKDKCNQYFMRYQVMGICSVGLEYICTLKQYTFNNEVWKYMEPDKGKHTMKFYTLTDAMYHLRDTYTNITDTETE